MNIQTSHQFEIIMLMRRCSASWQYAYELRYSLVHQNTLLTNRHNKTMRIFDGIYCSRLMQTGEQFTWSVPQWPSVWACPHFSWLWHSRDPRLLTLDLTFRGKVSSAPTPDVGVNRIHVDSFLCSRLFAFSVKSISFLTVITVANLCWPSICKWNSAGEQY